MDAGSNNIEQGTSVRRPDRAPARIQALATLPVFLRASGKAVLLAGGTKAAAWKAELLLAAGARVRCFAPDPCPDLREIARHQEGLDLHFRHWSPDDLFDVLIGLCDAESDEEAARFRAAARARGVPVNIIDRPEYCDFQFGSIVNRSPLVIGISTDGAAPVFGQALRARIEALLPHGFADWARAAKAWRAEIQGRHLPFRMRRLFWERFTDAALSESNTVPGQEQRDALLHSLRDAESKPAGKVLLVGAGPGDPELLTLRAVRALQSADVVLFDDLVSPAILDFARREAERINVGKRGYKPSCGQDEISAMLVAFGQAGKVVARLKGGDPLIFGRANEEIDALERAGIPVEVIPGVTAASGAAAALATSLTERHLARRLQFVTAHARDGSLPADLDWNALADPSATTAIYMGVHTLPVMIRRLREAGMPNTTPVIMVESATRRDQRIIAGTLADIIDRVELHKVLGPSLFLVGSVLGRTLARNLRDNNDESREAESICPG